MVARKAPSPNRAACLAPAALSVCQLPLALLLFVFVLLAIPACDDAIVSGPSAQASANQDATGDIGGVCKASDDCPCDHDDDCETGICVRGPDGEKVCAKPCGDGCPNDWKCFKTNKDGKITYLCLPDLLPDCVPYKEICDGLDNNCNGKTDELFCDDGNPCTDNICAPGGPPGGGGPNGDGCVAVPWVKPCEDGDLCTLGDSCADGQCVTGEPKVCTDQLECTLNGCALSGECTITLVQGACDDSSACTVGDQCKDGLCESGQALDCDDNNPCTDDTCNPLGGCNNVHNEGPCEDGNLCTPGDTCQLGACQGAPPVDCDDNNPCTKTFCNPAEVTELSNGCTATFAKDVCDDGDPCTTGDVCAQGVCTSGDDLGCNDNQPCTDDGCDEKGECLHKAKKVGDGCDDGDACTGPDACIKGGKCKGSQTSCNDSNPCTSDVCDPVTGKCLNVGVSGVACSDGDACTLGDKCQDGACETGSKKLCDDGEACTQDNCTGAAGACVFKPVTGACDDGDKCTNNDACSGGKCAAGVATTCPAPGPCKLVNCAPQSGQCVVSTMVDSVLCEDGKPCTQADRCDAGSCKAGPLLSCDDANVCTDDTCLAKSGTCAHVANSNSCDDGNPCTAKDTCKAGLCTPGKGSCACLKDADCAASGDNNPCNGALYCALASKTCEVNNSSIVACDKSKDTACAKLQCAQTSGVCEVQPAKNGSACDADGSVCTKGDFCKTAVCVKGPKLVCDDSNPCTLDACVVPLGGVAGGCKSTAKKSACSDGDPCTVGDACVAGKCAAGNSAPNCDDGNPCSQDACDKASGKCLSTSLSGGKCNDGNACTLGDLCQKGACVSASDKPPCDDGNPCTVETCNPKTGQCVAKAGPSAVACNDNNPCTSGDSCANGKCKAGTAPGCVPNSPCLAGACDKTTGKCASKPANEGGVCNDGDGCTLLDVCAAGKCVAKDGQVCNDNDPCTKDVCDSKSGKCSYLPSADVPGAGGPVCDDGSKCTFGDTCKAGKCTGTTSKNCTDGDGCTVDGCEAKTGVCTHTQAADGGACNDGTACTKNDSCTAGKCAGVPAVDCKTTDCLAVSCDAVTTKCSTFPKNSGGLCDDGVACTLVDVCVGGKCVAKNAVNPCDDNNACTVDACDKAAAKCTHVAGTDGIDCDDGDLCTFDDTCTGGECLPKSKADCDDDNPCTEDTCDQPTGGCVYKAMPAQPPLPCNDGNKCTLHKAHLEQTGKKTDLCIAGKCVGQPINCNDKNPCTNDGCDPKTGCTHTPTAAKPCNDGNACTNKDTCKGGACGGVGASCIDGNPCTHDSCNKGSGCAFPPKAGGCSDGTVCTTGDACKKGKCAGGKAVACDDKNPCTDDVCHAKNGCKFNNDNKNKCTDGEPCTAGEGCAAGKCVGGKPVACNDGSVCTTDSCVQGKGCAYIDLGNKGCDDGNKCTGPDVCKGGKCLGTGAKSCDDGNKCTVDVCQPGSGCANVQSKAKCSDGDACTVADVCSKGACVSGQARNCNDDSACTTDSCDKKSGCKHTKVSGACDDKNPCTSNDKCGAGVCSGVGKSCNDDNACTKDSCTLKSGCAHTKLNGTACTDDNPCTIGDTCKAGQCAATGAHKCDDEEPCTEDVCGKTGCTHSPAAFGKQQTGSVASSGTTQVSTQKKAGAGGLPELLNGKPAVAVTDGLPAWVKIAGASWIWHESKVADPTVGETMYLQQDFDVPAGSETLSGTLSIAADNSFECWLNNKLVGATDQGDDAYGEVHTLDLSAAMNAGKNRLVCAVHNIGKVGDTNKTNKAGAIFAVKSGWYGKGKSPACDDGNGCTGGDVCDKGACATGFPKNCDDDNPCSADSCDVGAGCKSTPANQNPCNDGSICSTNDHCAGGKCTGQTVIPCDDGNGCTLDKCHAKTGCYSDAGTEGVACDDGDTCTSGTVCSKGACGGGKVNGCDDGKACTQDSCDAAAGCKHGPLSGQDCNDGNGCTTGDKCAAGSCLGTGAKICDDGNACTGDSCSDGSCKHAAKSGDPCDDGNACTGSDTCDKGACAAGKLKSCFDTLQCTNDSCDAKTGKCVFTPVSDGDCDDGNLCTLNDSCKGGKCKSGPSAPCGDGNPCTTDSCDPSSGKCKHADLADGTGCADGNGCTLKDRCTTGHCAGEAKSCDDKKPCTVDSCTPATGACSHSNAADGTQCGTGACKSGVCL
jgi:hypothetical protein